MRFSHRCILFAALAFFVAAFSMPAVGQKSFIKNSEGSVGVIAEFSPTVSGNGITITTSKAAGGQATFRHSYHWWLGFQAGYTYTRFTEYYSSNTFPIQHNMHEFSGDYLVTAPTSLFGFKPYAVAGASAVVFSPSLNGGQNVPWQARPGINAGGGFERALVTQNFGIRIGYRGVYYKVPDYGKTYLASGARRLTSEPLAGLYFRF